MDVSDGPEGVLATTLRTLLLAMVEDALRDIKFKSFKKCFPAEFTKERNIPLLKKLYERMLDNIKLAVKSEYDVICGERQLVMKLNALDQLFCEQPKLQNGMRCPTAPSGTTTDKVQERIMEMKIAERDRLRKIASLLDEQNKATKKHVAQLEAEAAQLAANITRHSDISNSLTATQDCIEIKNNL